ncbi:MAG: hypothetical protein N2258_06770 [Brevinematales bacterium]|nr:hypothetical protein [Brevinematales bacterium]
MIKKVLKKLISFFGPRWIKMKIDKMFIDPLSGKFYVMLKGVAGKEEKFFLNSGFVGDDSVIRTLFFNNSSFNKKFLNSLGIRLRSVRIIRKIDAVNSAVCIFGSGLFFKKVYLSTVEALKLAHENNVPIYVKKDILAVNYYQLNEPENKKLKIQNSAFYAKFSERNFYKNEVIM